MKKFAVTMYPRLLQSSLPGETRALLAAAVLATALCVYIEVSHAQPIMQITAPNDTTKTATLSGSESSARLPLSASTAIAARDVASQRVTERRKRQATPPKTIAPETVFIHEQHRKLRPTTSDVGPYPATF
jgi:hypothetical protein